MCSEIMHKLKYSLYAILHVVLAGQLAVALPVIARADNQLSLMMLMMVWLKKVQQYAMCSSYCEDTTYLVITKIWNDRH